MKNLFITIISILVLFPACLNDLDVEPEVEQTLGNLLEEDPDAGKNILAKLYSTLALHGQGVAGGADQNPDIVGDDPGETVYLRSLWNLQEMTTDVVKNRWGDGGLDPLTLAEGWSSTNKFFGYMYNKIFFIVGQSNNFINDLNSVEVANKELFTAEARFLRALAYYNAMDLFGGVPLVTEADGIGSANKPRATRKEIFDFVESELKAIENTIPVSNEYGRANRAAVHMLLAKIYLNAEVFAGTDRYNDAVTYSQKVIAEGGFSLDDDYQAIFNSDNFQSPEIIFPIIGDRDRVQSFGNATYLVNGSYSSSTMNLADFGAENGWTGHRCTPALYSKFGDLGLTQDNRAIFWTEGHNFDMTDYTVWEDGYPTTKFRNTPAAGDTIVMNFSDVDFPLFRLADAYLMYAEGVLRGATTGDRATALQYVNLVRNRAFGSEAGHIADVTMTLDWLIDERARELYYEAHRRQDLIRYGLFTSATYVWPWKGGDPAGRSIPETYKLFPIPLEAVQANPNVEQNPGY